MKEEALVWVARLCGWRMAEDQIDGDVDDYGNGTDQSCDGIRDYRGK